jgi:hypothetical protein
MQACNTITVSASVNLKKQSDWMVERQSAFYNTYEQGLFTSATCPTMLPVLVTESDGSGTSD